MGLSSILPGMNIGIIIAIVIIIILQVVLNYTVFGFELKMSGLNRDAAKYCGVNQTKSIILALCIAGACAGIGGYIIYANPKYPLKFIYSSDSNSLLGTGFDGIISKTCFFVCDWKFRYAFEELFFNRNQSWK